MALTPAKPNVAEGDHMRILIVDDNRDIIELLQRVLRLEGHEVLIARDGLEALQQEASGEPDLVILDVNLPALDGWEVCRRIKARRAVPVVLLTVRAERADIERSRAAGADDHLLKPFEIGAFLKQIASISRPTPNVAPTVQAA
jgi:DNA-binding response OmpR family regulator